MKLKPTPEQKLIIKHLHGHAMVKAGPGCAKTATLALRVMHMLKQGYEPSSIVILTHGKALSLDIVETLSKSDLAGPVIQQITVSTIHSFAYLLVRKYYQLLEYDEVPTLVKQQGKNLFIKRHAKLTGLKLAELKQAFSQYDATSSKSAKVEAALGKDNATLAKKAYNQYSRYKMKRNTVDFNDMIKGAIKLLKLRPDSTLRGYEHLMVDELQDIDGPQKEFLLHLSLRIKSTVMVGDPLQSIYGWRSALPRYWTDIENALTPKQFVLTESFRTPQQALALVNDLGRRIDKYAPILTSKVNGESPGVMKILNLRN